MHRGPRAGWEGVSQTLGAPLTPRHPAVSPPPSARPPRPGAATRGISGLEAAGAPRLVVDATSGTPAPGVGGDDGGVQADGTPSRLATYVDARTGAVIRREQQIETVDGSGQSLYGGTVPLQLTPDGATYQLKDPTRGNTYTTDMGNKTDSRCARSSAAAAPPARCSPARTRSFGNGTHQQPRVGRGRRAVRHQRDLGLLQGRPRPQRHLRHRQGLLQPGPLRPGLRQRVLGRHQDDLRRRGRHQLRPARPRSTWPATRCRTASPRTPPGSPTPGSPAG